MLTAAQNLNVNPLFQTGMELGTQAGIAGNRLQAEKDKAAQELLLNYAQLGAHVWEADQQQKAATARAQASDALHAQENQSLDNWRKGELQRYAAEAAVKAHDDQDAANALGAYRGNGQLPTMPTAQTPTPPTAPPLTDPDSGDPSGDASAALQPQPTSPLFAPAPITWPGSSPTPNPAPAPVSAPIPTGIPAPTPAAATALAGGVPAPPRASMEDFAAKYPGALKSAGVRGIMTQEAIAQRAAEDRKFKYDQIKERRADTSKMLNELAEAKTHGDVLKTAAKYPNADMGVLRSVDQMTAKDIKDVLETVEVNGKTIYMYRNPATGSFKQLDDKDAKKAEALQSKLTGITGQLTPFLKKKLQADAAALDNPRNPKVVLSANEQNHLIRLQSERSGVMAQLRSLTNAPSATITAPTAAPAAAPASTSGYKTADDVKAAVQSGSLSRDDGVKILKAEFNFQ